MTDVGGKIRLQFTAILRGITLNKSDRNQVIFYRISYILPTRINTELLWESGATRSCKFMTVTGCHVTNGCLFMSNTLPPTVTIKTTTTESPIWIK